MPSYVEDALIDSLQRTNARLQEENRRLRTLLERARIGAWHEACGDHADPDPCWHCCDWRELAEEIDAALRGEQP